ncbi:MAG: hypothetical protein U0270_34560 [Labilithrix sp.]
MKRWRAIAALSAVTAVAIACGPGFLDGISGGTRDVPDAAEASVTPGKDSGRACTPTRLPERPPGVDDQISVPLPTFAFESLRVDTHGGPDAGGAIPTGIDQDDRCTCPETESCVRRGDAALTCDGKGGEDNAMSELFNSVNRGIPLFPQTFATDRIHNGFFTILVDVLGWNGTDNDPAVTVTLRLSQQIDEKKVDGGFPPPKFDGTDVWTVDPDSVAGGVESIDRDCRVPADSYRCIPRVRDDSAFVRDGLLVARPRFDAKADGPVKITVRAGLGDIDFELFEHTLTGRLVRGEDGGVARLDGELTGRVLVTNVLRTLGNLEDFTSEDKSPVCRNPALLTVARSSVCNTPDLAAPGKDNTGASCDHISVAMSFSGRPAIVSRIFQKQTAVPTCDESVYSCP